MSVHDRVIVYFCCRWQTEADEIYLLPFDASLSKVNSTAIPIDSLKNFAKSIPVKHLLFVLDASISKSSRIQFTTLPNLPTPQKSNSGANDNNNGITNNPNVRHSSLQDKIDDAFSNGAVELICAGW